MLASVVMLMVMTFTTTLALAGMPSAGPGLVPAAPSEVLHEDVANIKDSAHEGLQVLRFRRGLDLVSGLI